MLGEPQAANIAPIRIAHHSPSKKGALTIVPSVLVAFAVPACSDGHEPSRAR